MQHLHLAGLPGVFIPNDATEADVDRAIRRAELVRDLRQARENACALEDATASAWRLVATLEAELAREGRAVR